MNGNRKYDDQELKTADLKAFLEYGGEFLNIVRPQIKSALVDLENTAEQLQNKTRRLDADLSSINEKYQKLLNIPANSRDLEKLSRLLENNTARISEDLPRIINQYQKLLDLQAKAQENESKLRNAAPQAPARVSEKLVNEVQEKAQSGRISEGQKALLNEIEAIKSLVKKYAETAPKNKNENEKLLKELVRLLKIEVKQSGADDETQDEETTAVKTHKLKNYWNNLKKSPNFFVYAAGAILVVIILAAFIVNYFFKDPKVKEEVSSAQKIQTTQEPAESKTGENTGDKAKEKETPQENEIKAAALAENYQSFKSKVEGSIKGSVVEHSIEGNKFAVITKLPKELSGAEAPHYLESKYNKNIKDGFKSLKEYFALDKIESRFNGESIEAIIEYPAMTYEKCGKGTEITSEKCNKKEKIKADELGGYVCSISGGYDVNFSQEQPVWPDIASSKFGNIKTKDKTGELLGCMRAASLAKELKLSVDKTKLAGKKCYSIICDQQSDNILIRLEITSINTNALEALKKALQQHN